MFDSKKLYGKYYYGFAYYRCKVFCRCFFDEKDI